MLALGSLDGGDDTAKVLEWLVKFKADLGEHLALEDGIFYPDFMAKKTARGGDMTDTKKFIEEMNQIGIVVGKFLNDYDTEEKIEAKVDVFRQELVKITGTLKVRIETEKEGVYDFYLVM